MNVTIIGGGTAGWLTALYINKISPNFKITLIESEEIGILGAGEGTTPVFPSFLQNLGIEEIDIIKETNATFKVGISFENWRGDGKKYMHGFAPISNEINYERIVKNGESTLRVGLPFNGTQYTFINLIANNENFDDNIATHLIPYKNKGPYIIHEKQYVKALNYAYHFDALLMAKFLRKKGEERGIKRIKGTINEILSNEDKTIKGFKIKDEIHECDFVFDCSGFNRLIIGNHFKSDWISYKDQLKVNEAITFFLPQEDEYIIPYTKSIAMKHGWMWMIPLQNRYGCGYIYDSNYINEETAKKEIDEYFNKEIKINKTFKFEAGCYKTPWIKNCIAIGLSAGFTEPIEATSIWISLLSLQNLSGLNIKEHNDLYREDYNKYINDLNESILELLYYHYLTDRNDTDFWKNYKRDTIIPESLKRKLKKWKYRTPNMNDKNTIETFPVMSYIEIGLGISNELIPLDVFLKENEEYNLNGDFKKWMENYKYNVNQCLNLSIDHKELINDILKLTY